MKESFLTAQLQNFHAMFSSLVRDQGQVDTRISNARQLLAMGAEQIVEFMQTEPGMLAAQLSSLVGLAPNFDPRWIEDRKTLSTALGDKNIPLMSKDPEAAKLLSDLLKTESTRSQNLYCHLARILWEVSKDASILPFLTVSTQHLHEATTELAVIGKKGEGALTVRDQGNALEDFIAKFGDDKHAADLMHRGLTLDQLVEILRDRGDWFSATVQIVDLEIIILALLQELAENPDSAADVFLSWTEHIRTRPDYEDFLDWETPDGVTMRERLLLALFVMNEEDLRPILRLERHKTGLELDRRQVHNGHVSMVKEVDLEDRYHNEEFDGSPHSAAILVPFGIDEVDGAEELRGLLNRGVDYLVVSLTETEILRKKILADRQEEGTTVVPLKDAEKRELEDLLGALR
ncbi:MAG: hypothetical protein UU08_C0001G0014 [Candidatus Uhrbacteria bacterium GW2011_GWE2_40_58]|nr:MAG: hypothetical protein UT94_C0001G0014 [Candidatus Uhrbacteria bacterium GW2011_GWF2_40_263]KKR68240.1 MAG: hypothetical protein UU08_C0001G0014 [Candidatus Uhrbacteria bacterium GW2011_GWE2_40_58]OGL92044.1 MAG: hypothetical protein A2239_03455 [Candidatus Uhrbacteria bacterium RIFOXYA2_FULL_40_9]OGL97501.1 MAG: hypothetical protein A2332_00160 [Candidatus Uhrbacteria bacterium RIFOXYB2_FULL_41_18]HBK35112.1 hypothetical protein [Candidatus Uhrbacteria bacterium]